MRIALWIAMCLLAAPVAGPAPDNGTSDEATEAMDSPEENQADRAMAAVKPNESPEVVERKVTDFLNSYPGSRRRRDVRNRLVEAYVRTGRTADAVDECMRLAFDLSGTYLDDQALRDSWLQLASLFSRQNNPVAAANVRVRTYLRFPYQLENRRQLGLAVAELAQAGRHPDVLAVGKLALAVLPDAESAGVLDAVKQSLDALQGKQTAERFEAWWQQGVGRNPLADVAVPGQDVLCSVARADLANEGLLVDKPEIVSLQRGVLHVFAGDLPTAAQELQNAVSAARPSQKELVADLVGVYFRWIDGSAVRARQYRSYVRWGKPGADGVIGSEDDLANPFVQALSAGAR